MAAIDCVGSANPGGVLLRFAGNDGAPADVGPRLTVNVRGEPLNCSAFS
jgi:hypothetical protein